MTNKHIKKTDAELIFTKDCVYKIFTTNIVDDQVLDDLFRLDKLANTKPLFLGKTDLEHSPFNAMNVEGNPTVMIMRLLNDIDSLSTRAQYNKITEDILESLAKTLYTFHQKTIFNLENDPTYFADRLSKDLKLVSDVVSKEPSINNIFQKVLDIVEQNKDKIDKRSKEHSVVEGHGDLNLDHIYLEGNDFCFIDFSHKKKYRVDDPTRDLAGIVLHLLELNKKGLVKPFVDFYKAKYSDEDFDLMLKLQLGKKFLVKYFIYFGGFAPEHREDDQLELCLNTANDVLGFISQK